MPCRISILRELFQLQSRKFILRRFINIERSLIMPNSALIPGRNPRKPSLPINLHPQRFSLGGKYISILQTFNTPSENYRPRRCIVRMKILTSDKFIRIYDIALTHICLLKIGSTETRDKVRSLKPGNDIYSNQEK